MHALCAKNMCVQQVSVCTPPVAHTVVATTWVRNPTFFSKNKNHHSMTTLIFPTRTCSTNVHSTNCQMYELMLLGFPRHAVLLILDDAFVWNLNLSPGSPRSTISNCVSHFSHSSFSGSRSSRHLFLFDMICGF